jgi:hypothetical protein
MTAARHSHFHATSGGGPSPTTPPQRAANHRSATTSSVTEITVGIAVRMRLGDGVVCGADACIT